MLERELEVVLAATEEAVAAVLEVYAAAAVEASSQGVVQKAGGAGPVTEADRRANAIFVERLSAAFPEDAILAEESADDPRRRVAARLWCVDPVDGTKEFIARNGEFSVMVGLVDRASGRPLLGVVSEPATGLLMVAVAGQGAWKVLPGGERSMLRASDRSEGSALKLIVSRSHPDPETRAVVASMGPASVTPCGSVGVKIGRIVQGEADAYLNFSGKTRLWDTCAPDIILEEAGGRLTTLDGRPLDYGAESTVNEAAYVASNGASHALVLAHCRRAVGLEEAVG